MPAEIIAVGTELTTGAKLDTNSQWLSIELAAEGIAVHYHTTVADDLAANVAVMRAAVERADIVIITGGLGPTLDDLTREALAQVAGVPLVRHEPSLAIIQQMFASRNRVMPERNVIQAMFPEGSEPIPNPRGTAPGIWFEIPRIGGNGVSRVAALPGVPTEMKGMFRDSVLPRIDPGAAEKVVIRRACINCFGLGESQAEEMLGGLTARGREPEVGITVHEATITLRIEARGRTAAECEAKIEEARRIARERLGEAIFSEGQDEMQHVVVGLLAARGATLSTAESRTGGLVAHWLTEAAGHETCYIGGVVALGGPAKHQWLDVDPVWLKEVGTVSGPVAGRMATICRERFGSDYAVAVTESPRHEDASPLSPLAYIALAGPRGVEVRECHVLGDPLIQKSRLGKMALNLLRTELLRPE